MFPPTDAWRTRRRRPAAGRSRRRGPTRGPSPGGPRRWPPAPADAGEECEDEKDPGRAFIPASGRTLSTRTPPDRKPGKRRAFGPCTMVRISNPRSGGPRVAFPKSRRPRLATIVATAALPRLLAAAGAPGAAAPSPPAAAPRRTVAVTVDDLPFVAYGLPLEAVAPLSRKLVAALAARKVKAVAFVNEDKLFVPGEVDERIALLTEWLDAGMELGNHTFGHVGLTRTPLPAMQDAVVKGEVVTRGLLERRGTDPEVVPPSLHAHGDDTRDQGRLRGLPRLPRLHRGAASRSSTRTGSSRRPTRSSPPTATRRAARGEDVKALSRAGPEAPKWVADLATAQSAAASAPAPATPR